MTLTLRGYQQDAIDGLYSYWADGRGDHPLIVMPTGSGKSLVLAKLVQDALEFPGTHILMLTHVKELIAQNAAELKGILPDVDLGIYSAGLGQKRLDRQVTFAGIQSIWKRAYDMIPPPDLVIIDESHLVPRNSETRYGKFLADLYECNPNVKIVGLTATPFRLDSGYLHKGKGALFDGIAYDVPVGRLIDEGWLAPVVSKGSSHQIDLTNVRMRGGEFVEGDLAMAASDPELVRSTVEEIVSVGADRKSWLIFASGVDHANMIAAEMEGHGIDCEIITGGTAKTDRQDRIEDFKAGRLRCLVNVNVLTTGFNAPGTDLVALVRATASTALYVQMIGRGTRTAPDKENCLVLDYGGNVLRHGLFDAVHVKEVKSGGGGDAPVKACPECETMVPAGCNYCPQCAYKFPPPELNHGQAAYDGALTTDQVVAEWVDVSSVTYARHQKAGKPDSVRVTYHCGLRDFREWLCPDHGGYAASRYRARMPALGAEAMTTNDALNEAEKFWTIPDRIKIKPRVDDPRYHEIIQLDYSGGRKPERRDEIDWEAGYEDAFDDAF